MTANRALDAALALARDPTLAGVMRRQPLPAGVTALLEFVAGEAASTFEPADGETIKAVAERYIQDVMLFPGAPSPRILGVNDGEDRALARAHLKLLMKWLHPDHSDDAWRSAFAGRVVGAWKELSQAPLVAPSRAIVPAAGSAPPEASAPPPPPRSRRPAEKGRLGGAPGGGKRARDRKPPHACGGLGAAGCWPWSPWRPVSGFRVTGRPPCPGRARRRRFAWRASGCV